MSKSTRITLEQQRRLDRDSQSDRYLYKYKVLNLVNTTEPKIDRMLTQKEVDALITSGHDVTIKQESD